jgi:acetyltransferase-like isoleucine patch superfamily enzyme
MECGELGRLSLSYSRVDSMIAKSEPNSASVHDLATPRALRLLESVFGLFPSFVGARLITASLRAAGVRLGRTSLFWGIPHFEGDAKKHLQIGERCGFNVRSRFELGADLIIEDHVSVGHEVTFLAREPIRIGTGSWIGARATIHPGVTIGPGTIIGPLTEVKSDVGANLLVVGNRKVSIANWRQG